MFYEGHWFGGGFMWIFWILLIVLVIWAINGSSGRNQDSGEKSALEILKQRYARGEIDQEEFTQKKKDLEG